MDVAAELVLRKQHFELIVLHRIPRHRVFGHDTYHLAGGASRGLRHASQRERHHARNSRIVGAFMRATIALPSRGLCPQAGPTTRENRHKHADALRDVTDRFFRYDPVTG